MTDFEDMNGPLKEVQSWKLSDDRKHAMRSRLRLEWETMRPGPISTSRGRRFRRSSIAQVSAAVVVLALVGFGAFYTRSQQLQGAGHETPEVTNASVSAQIHLLLRKYGWTAQGQEHVTTYQLPSSFQTHEPGYPVGLFWRYENVLCQDIGYDLSPYLGKDVRVHILPVKEHWAEAGPNPDDVVVIESRGKVVGAWLKSGWSLGASLQKHFFGDITHQTWGSWLTEQGYTDLQVKSSPVDPRADSLTVLNGFFRLVNQHQVAKAYELYCYQAQLNMMMTNVDVNRQLYQDYRDSSLDGLNNVVYWKLSKIKPARYLPGDISKTFNSQPVSTKEYYAEFMAKYKKIIVQPNGRGGYFFTLTQETKNGPWRIGGYGTGP